LKILILKPSSLGDVVQALPVLRLLKLHLPESEIFWWLGANLVPLLGDDPDLSGIFPFDRGSWATPRHWPQIWNSIRALRQKHFDWVIDLQGLARSAIFAWLANGSLIVGLDNPREGAREGARIFYDLIAPRSPVRAHAVDRYLSVLPALGVPVHFQFQWLPERPQVKTAILERWAPGAATPDWIALLPGARWDNKRWPVAHFVELVKRLSRAHSGITFAILGSAADRELARAIHQADPKRCLDLTGQTSLPEMIEWVRLSRLVITNDTGPMHVAAALGKPIIAIFGPSDPDNSGPYGQRDQVMQARDLACVPCLKSSCSYEKPLACLHAITPAMVLAAAQKRLAETVVPNAQ
jgi:lipopolysaccharide heptosyltransferase I